MSVLTHPESEWLCLGLKSQLSDKVDSHKAVKGGDFKSAHLVFVFF